VSTEAEPQLYRSIATDTNGLRGAFARLAEQFFGPEGLRQIQASRWAVAVTIAPILGVTSDVLQVFGDAAFWLFATCLMAFVLLAALCRTRAAGRCARPCVLASIGTLVFGLALAAQVGVGGTRGALAETLPPFADFQQRVFAALDRMTENTEEVIARAERIETTTSEIQVSQSAAVETDAKKNASLERIEATNKRILDLVSSAEGIPVVTLQRILSSFGESDIPLDPAQIEEKLLAKAEEYRILTAGLNPATTRR